MSEWVRLCAEAEAPEPGDVAEKEVAGVSLCLANIDGELHALDNWCPHRRAALGQGWVEGRTVVCPAHCWAFEVGTGIAEPPENARVAVFSVQVQAGAVLVNLG